MLLSTNDLQNYALSATDGPIGHLTDLYFDDDAWVVRYFVVNAGSWLASRMVLISPISVHHPTWLEQTLPVSITREQVRNSPHMDTDKPVSRQHEMEYLGFYGYPYYWGGAGMWGEGIYPYALLPGYAGFAMDRVEIEREQAAFRRAAQARHRNDDPHLRSCNAVVGYHLHASDGEIGHVAGFLVDDETWAIRYLIADTSNWWLGHQVLVAPQWITGVHWTDKTVSVDLSRDAIKHAPRYDADLDWDPAEDERLHRHYDQAGSQARHTMLEAGL